MGTFSDFDSQVQQPSHLHLIATSAGGDLDGLRASVNATALAMSSPAGSGHSPFANSAAATAVNDQTPPTGAVNFGTGEGGIFADGENSVGSGDAIAPSGAGDVGAKETKKKQKATKPAVDPAASKLATDTFATLKAVGERALQYEADNASMRDKLLGGVAVVVHSPGFSGKAFFAANGLKWTKSAQRRPGNAIIQALLPRLDPKLASKWSTGLEYAFTQVDDPAHVESWFNEHGVEAAVKAARAARGNTAAPRPRKLVIVGAPAGLAECEGEYTITFEVVERGKPGQFVCHLNQTAAAPASTITDADIEYAETGESSVDGTPVEGVAADQAASIDPAEPQVEEAA